jgi:hypothetical protein
MERSSRLCRITCKIISIVFFRFMLELIFSRKEGFKCCRKDFNRAGVKRKLRAPRLIGLPLSLPAPGAAQAQIRQLKKLLRFLCPLQLNKKRGPAASYRSLGLSFNSRSKFSLTRPPPKANRVNPVWHLEEFTVGFDYIPDRQPAPHRYLGIALVPTHRQVNVATSPVRMVTRCCLGRVHQQETQQRTAWFADV